MFTERRLELPILSKIQVDYQFNTIILENGAGEEQRIPRSTEYRFRGDFGSLLLNQQEVETLVNFYNARQGRYEGFRIQNPCDYEATAEPRYLDDNEQTYTQGIVYSIPGTNKEFQLVKAYCSGNRCSYKTVTKPVEDTVFAYEDGTKLVIGYSIDLASGRLVFDSAPAGEITWAGEYDLPVRFDAEELPRVQEVYDADNECGSFFTFDSLPIVELLDKRVPIYQKKDFVDGLVQFQLDIHPKLEYRNTWKTLIEESTVGYENRLTYNNENYLYGAFQGSILYEKEADYLTALFISCRGRFNAFIYNWVHKDDEISMRFDSDVLSLQLEGATADKELIYNYSDLPFKEIRAQVDTGEDKVHYPFVSRTYRIEGAEARGDFEWSIVEGAGDDGNGNPLVSLDDPNRIDPVLTFEEEYYPGKGKTLTLKLESLVNPAIFDLLKIETNVKDEHAPIHSSYSGELREPKIELNAFPSQPGSATQVYKLTSPYSYTISDPDYYGEFLVKHELYKVNPLQLVSTIDADEKPKKVELLDDQLYQIKSSYRFNFSSVWSSPVGKPEATLAGDEVNPPVSTYWSAQDVVTENYFRYVSLREFTFEEPHAPIHTNWDTITSQTSYFLYASSSEFQNSEDHAPVATVWKGTSIATADYLIYATQSSV